MPDDSPIDGQVLLLTAAKASVAPKRVPELVSTVDDDLRPRLDSYRLDYEVAAEDDERVAFFVPLDRWESIGARLGFGRRETDAARRAHEEQALRMAKRSDQRSEFETALEIREVVVVSV